MLRRRQRGQNQSPGRGMLGAPGPNSIWSSSSRDAQCRDMRPPSLHCAIRTRTSLSPFSAGRALPGGGRPPAAVARDSRPQMASPRIGCRSWALSSSRAKGFRGSSGCSVIHPSSRQSESACQQCSSAAQCTSSRAPRARPSRTALPTRSKSSWSSPGPSAGGRSVAWSSRLWGLNAITASASLPPWSIAPKPPMDAPTHSVRRC
mmetsp:Transcript_136587/g.380720  ORF Transcript_136587/g.380720 Transcript_136587/m.380720 type:complete len:205 (+) Transcript_136587:282-896(+)